MWRSGSTRTSSTPLVRRRCGGARSASGRHSPSLHYPPEKSGFLHPVKTSKPSKTKVGRSVYYTHVVDIRMRWSKLDLYLIYLYRTSYWCIFSVFEYCLCFELLYSILVVSVYLNILSLKKRITTVLVTYRCRF